MKKFARNMKKAFTITELVIVIAVIAILAAVLIPTFSSVISSARESAAMQECHNALINYAAEAEKEGVSTTGMVFVNNDYVFVNLNGTLQMLGETDELLSMNSAGTVDAEAFTAFKEQSTAMGSAVNDFETSSYNADKGIKITITDESGNPQTKNDKPIKLTKEVDGAKVLHDVENLYLYYIKLNDTEYVGYFTLEEENSEGSNVYSPQFTANNGSVRYSRAFGFIALKGSASITFAAGT